MRSKFTQILTLLLAFIVHVSFAQEKTITGNVTDETGMPLPGVNIVVEGTTNGTQTDFDGNYSILASPGQVLVYTYVGMTTSRQTVGSSSRMSVQLKEDAQALEEVVVVAYGRKISRNEYTGTAVAIGEEDVKKVPFVSVEQALQGKVAGASITGTSGVPGSTQQIRIRGIQSINASNAPLYVIDGVPVTQADVTGSANITSFNPLATISQDNIESITVLKDAIDTAPYGASGSNGVILITTKTGRGSKPTFNLSASTGFMNNASKGLIPMTADQKADAMSQAVWNTFGSDMGDGRLTSRDQVEDFMLANIGRYSYWNSIGRPNNNWYELVQNKDAVTRNIDFSVSQGGEKQSLYVGLGYNYTEATVIGSDFKRISGNIKYTNNLTDRLRLSVSANVSNVEQNAALEQGGFFSNPNLIRYFMSPWVNPYNEDGTPDIENIRNYTSIHNVLFTSKENLRRNDVTRALSVASLEYDVASNLTFRSVMNLDYLLSAYKGYNSPLHGDGFQQGGTILERISRRFTYTAQNSLNYNFTLNDVHHFDATGLVEFTKYNRNFLEGYGENMANNYLRNISGATANYDATSEFQDRMSLRYVALLNYNFDRKYLIDASYTYQGDSRFSKDKRFGHFYSFGVGWNIHEEEFMSGADFVDVLRLRGSYGRTGNADIAINSYQALTGIDPYNNNPSSYVSGYGTSAGWEIGIKRDVGLVFELFGRRLTGGVNYYNNDTKDMLLRAPLGYSSQFIGDLADPDTSVLQNLGTMRNSGWEFEVGGDIIRSGDFTWHMSANMATVKNEVTLLPEDARIVTGTRMVEEGRMLYEWYMPEWAGVDPENGDPLWYTDETRSETTNQYAQAGQVLQGHNAIPKFTGGVDTRFDFKGFFVDAGIYFAGGHQVYEDWAYYTNTSSAGLMLPYNSTQVVYKNAWQQPGDIASSPRFDYNDPNVQNASSTSTRFLYDGDYIRLRNLAFGYSFTGDQLKSVGFIDGLTLSVRGTNLATWVKDDRLKYDPEVRADGFTNLTTPPVKSVIFGVNVSF